MSEEIKNRFLELMGKKPKEQKPKKKISDLWRWDTLEDVNF